MNTVLVIGGSSGIGKAICHRLKDEYQVINMSRRKNEEVDNIYCDTTDYMCVKSAFIELNDKYDVPYGIIYCSGIVEVQSIYELTENALVDTFQTNILGCFRVVHEYLKINKSEGKIILIGSTSGSRASPSWDVYSSTKAAVINFGLTLGEELKTENKKVYIISPGRTASELRSKLCPNEDPSTIMQPITVANFIYKLIHDDDGYLSNQNIIIKRQ